MPSWAISILYKSSQHTSLLTHADSDTRQCAYIGPATRDSDGVCWAAEMTAATCRSRTRLGRILPTRHGAKRERTLLSPVWWCPPCVVTHAVGKPAKHVLNCLADSSCPGDDSVYCTSLLLCDVLPCKSRSSSTSFQHMSTGWGTLAHSTIKAVAMVVVIDFRRRPCADGLRAVAALVEDTEASRSRPPFI